MQALKDEILREGKICPNNIVKVDSFLNHQLDMNIIKKIGGKQEVKAHLENLGFVAGGAVTVINTIGGNVIVNVKESRVAVSKEMAQKIMI